MARSPLWPWWKQDTGSDEYRVRELLRAILDLHAYYGDSNIWLWRGQANATYALTPAIHSRITVNGDALDVDTVVARTAQLLQRARDAMLDRHEGAALPDMALLAMLQHHGAATPLLDVSLDPLVALYMAVVSPRSLDDEQAGVLFAIRKPQDTRPVDTIGPFDTRTFDQIYRNLRSNQVSFYSSPDVSERLRIQRGHFLLAQPSGAHPQVDIPLTIEPSSERKTWLNERMDKRGKPGRLWVPVRDIGTFRIPPQHKAMIRRWLESRTGLTADFVYPTAWHQPHLEVFAKSHGRFTAY